MGTRLRALGIVVLLVAIMGAMPGFAPRAAAEPRVVTVATHDIEPFVMTHDNIKTGFTVEILEEIAKHEGWTINYVDVESADAQLKAIAENKADGPCPKRYKPIAALEHHVIVLVKHTLNQLHFYLQQINTCLRI